MLYRIKRIEDRSAIEACDRFFINQYMWDSKQEPNTYGWAGYVEGQGLYVKMVCEEKDPKREFKNPRDMVCKDSAMEVFFAFPEEGEEVSNDSMYISFEMNANGILYAKYGKGRKNRSFITEEQCEEMGCKAYVEEEKWSVEVLITEDFLQQVCDFDAFKSGKKFYCNFYKIADCEEIRHYGSYSPIDSEMPNFHLPVCFAEAVIE